MTSGLLDERLDATPKPRSRRRRPDATTAALTAVAVAAVAVLVLWPRGLHATATEAAGWAGGAAYLGMWTAMTLAMMLPTSRPLLLAVRRMGRRDRRQVQAAVVAGYLVVWTAAGAVALAVTLGGRRLVEALTPATTNGGLPSHLSLANGSTGGSTARLVTAALLLGAGLFHLSPWAASCLRRCRSPFGFLARGWHGRAPLADGLRIGFAYGRSCLGCCVAPMTAMVLVGMHSLVWMAAFGLLTARQKTSIWGSQLRVVSGVGLLVAAGVLAVV